MGRQPAQGSRYGLSGIPAEVHLGGQGEARSLRYGLSGIPAEVHSSPWNSLNSRGIYPR